MNHPPARPWNLCDPDPEIVTDIGRKQVVKPLLARLLANRGHTPGEPLTRHLEPTLMLLHDPDGLPDMQQAVKRLQAAIDKNEVILIHGDYDVDGVTGTTILVRLLRLLEARVEWHIPHRRKDGYSFGPHSIKKAQEVGASLIVSVDNGTSAVEVINELKDLGIDTIVTDHHEPPQGDLPEAVAIVNPKMPDSSYPFRELCGGAVAYKLAWGLCQAISGGPKVRPSLKEFLLDAMGLVAIATVGDVVPLLDENRVLARAGLKALQASPHPGTRALLQVCGLTNKTLAADDIGFGIGPRINAAGRLDTAALAVELLLEEEPVQARALAKKLEDLNQERKNMTSDLMVLAEEAASEFSDTKRWPILVLAGQGWHQGLVGIVAGRMVETHGRPTIVIGLDGETGRASARTVQGVSILELMHAGKEHVLRYGGHAAAAGCEIKAEQVGAYRDALCNAARETLSPDSFGASPLKIDAVIPLAQVGREVQEQVDRLEPFGEGNPSPVLLACNCRLAEPARASRDGKHLILKLRDGGTVLRAMGFFQGERIDELQMGEDLHIAFTPVWNEFRGERNQELRVLDFAVGEMPPLEVQGRVDAMK
ncbi:MAG: single-stranded-DNA-specific exonuclease RecJ [Planctomycetes bacterium]|nr:single-stranded-DNA-specific exonuclease RecJ [Planctomycetota bacterium]